MKYFKKILLIIWVVGVASAIMGGAQKGTESFFFTLLLFAVPLLIIQIIFYNILNPIRLLDNGGSVK